jgi:hypothetical protein
MSMLSPSGAGSCTAQNGDWTGVVSFTVDNCVIRDLILYVYASDGGQFTVSMLYADKDIPIRNDQFSHSEQTNGGTFTVNGKFTSPTAVSGRYTLTEGMDIGMITVIKDMDDTWDASPI